MRNDPRFGSFDLDGTWRPARNPDLGVSPEARWQHGFTLEDLQETADRADRRVRARMRGRLFAGGVVVLALLAASETAGALAAAVFTLGFAFVPVVGEMAFQLKLGVGALGMLTEEVRSLHLRLNLRPADSQPDDAE